jgi:hypothetical protein
MFPSISYDDAFDTDMPFDTGNAYSSLKSIDIKKVLTVFKKPWKKNGFDMNRFNLVPETDHGHHPNLESVYNDGYYTLRLFYGTLPIASIGVVSDNDATGNFLNVLQIQGVPSATIRDTYYNHFKSDEQDKIRDVIQSFYWSHALLTIGAAHLFDMGVEDVRVLSFYYNSNTSNRRDAFDIVSKDTSVRASKTNAAYITYDLTALTLGFQPMLSTQKVPSDVTSVRGLSFNMEGVPDKKVKFYGMKKDNYIDSVVYDLVNKDVQNTMPLVKNIHRTLGNYRQKELNFDIDISLF